MKVKQLLAAALLMGGTGAWAQTDVTSTYLTNADFSQGTPITVGTCTYEKDKAGNNTNYAQLVPVDGWDIPANGDARAGGLIAFGSGVWIGGPGYIAPATNSDGDAEGNILGLVGVWGGTAQYTQDVTLPAGTYTLVLGVYNSVGGTSAFTKNLIGFIENSGTEHLASTKNYAVNTWKYEFITFTLAAETAGKISLGYQGSNVGSGGAQHLFLSGIQLFNGEVDAAAYEAAKEAARNAKELAANKEKLAGSSPTNPSADLLVNGSFDTQDSGWTLNNMGYQLNGERPTRYVEKWNGSALTGSGSASQTIKNMPAGAYILTGTVNAQLQSNQALEITGAAINVNATSVATSGAWKDYTVNYVHENDGDIAVSFAYENTNANWVSVDGFSLVYVGGYVATTGITADDVTVEQAQTAEIGAAIAPANASYPALSYASADESVATVDANGVVTGVAPGSTTITITSAEATKVINVTVSEPTYVPESIELSQAAFEFDGENYTAQLVASVLPAAATQSVEFTTSDASVATVDAEGNITGVSTGTATITVTSSLDATVSATANVTVNFPEYAPEATTIVLNGAEKTITTIGNNLIKNGAFEYPDAYTGWTVGTGAKMAAAQFTVEEEEGNHYIQSVLHTGSNSAGSLRQAWPIEAGKKYVFGFKIKNVSGSQANNNEWIRVSLCNANPTSGDGTIVTPYPSYNGEWTDYSVVVDNTESDFTFVQAHFRWLGADGEHTAFDDFFLSEITDITTVGNVQYALDAVPTANIGDAVFRYSQTAIDAIGADALVDGVATVSDVENAYNALQALELNAPAEDDVYSLYLVDGINKTVTFKAGNATSGTYAIGYTEDAGSIYNQAIHFAKVENNKYKLYIVDDEGVKQYICTSATGWGDGTRTDRIRMTTDAEKALAIEIIATSEEGVYNLLNTEANALLGSNGDSGFFTADTYKAFNINAATEATVELKVAAGKYATRIFPFTPALPAGINAYACETIAEKELTLTPATELKANVPYILENTTASDVEESLSGYGVAKDATYTAGLLTGVYAETPITAGYVLQTLSGVQAFYSVDSEAAITVPAFRAYLTVPAADGQAKAFFFPRDIETAIQGVEAQGVQNAVIFNLAGQRVSKAQKGIYVVNGKKVAVK